MIENYASAGASSAASAVSAAGAALAGAVEVAKRDENKDKNIVIIFPDGGDHYLSVDGLFEV